MTSTVILGSGIIGLSTAYYLSKKQPGSSIHLVDSSAELFSSASGYAGGFIAKDWFEPSIASLGELSFAEHEKLAWEEDGHDAWGYKKTLTVSFEPGTARGQGRLSGRRSRSEAASGEKDDDSSKREVPLWLKRTDGDSIRVIDDEQGTAIVDPLRLCQFLLQKCKEAGVQLHYPATALSIMTDARDEVSGIRVGYTDSSTETELPATRIMISAGAWSSAVFASLFKKTSTKIPVSGYSGHSLVVKAPAGTTTKTCHAVYCHLLKYSPEVYARNNGVIYLAGVNSSAMPLPELATGAKAVKESVDELKKIATQLIRTENDGEELEVVRTGLCFRPVTRRGTPYITRLNDDQLGDGVWSRTGAEGGVFLAAGHGPWGISLSLGTGKVMSELMSGRELSADISALGL